MRLAALFALAALVPAASNAAPVQAVMTVPLCTGDGQARLITMPLGSSEIPGKEEPGCCVKGCHASGQRKRAGKLNGE